MSNYTTLSIEKNSYLQLAQMAQVNKVPIAGMVKRLIEQYQNKNKKSLEELMQPIWKEARKLKPLLKDFDSTKLDYSHLTREDF